MKISFSIQQTSVRNCRLKFPHRENLQLPGLEYYINNTSQGLWQGFYQLASYNLLITLKLFKMGNILYIIAVVLIVIWAISFLGGFFTGGIIHVLLVIAVIMIIFKLIARA